MSLWEEANELCQTLENNEDKSHTASAKFIIFYEQGSQSDGDTDSAGDLKGSGDGQHIALGVNSEGERRPDRSVVSNDSTKSDFALDDHDVAEVDIPWEEISLGECIRLGINCTLLYKN
ncbi:hypothetical protein DEO72_LG5g2270 [Vigna unguiculata]|uniref:Uncharacterized protein n=1 Tax=Vigna unguiculata TaxID=3917 RepID=A0A4D6M039_VIGUN|nr:hypothetical protein DEO72_LG5g2270 [Vigna unguiculata]